MQTPTTLPVHDGAGSDAGANNSDADYTDTQHASHDVDDVEAGYAHEQHCSLCDSTDGLSALAAAS